MRRSFGDLGVVVRRGACLREREGDMSNYYTESPLWYEKIGNIHALMERVKISEERFKEQNGDVLRLRKMNRIMSVHASTAIEGNRLTLGQVTNVINGVPVWGPPKDIKEVQNAWRAYNEIESYDPWSVDDLLKAHSLMTSELIGESGEFRSVNVAVVRGDGVVLHRGANPADVPRLVRELLEWGRESLAHPLIKSSAVHFMLEHIHPFRDGNGRIGRLWQTLVLSKWNPLLAWMPIETLVHFNQALYYQALQDSHSENTDCKPFIDCMLDMIENSMYRYIDVATETTGITYEPIDESTKEPINLIKEPVNRTYEPTNEPIKPACESINEPTNPVYEPTNESIKPILTLIKRNPQMTYEELAKAMGKSRSTVFRLIQMLRKRGRIVRVGANKNGHWEVMY
jgi:Fic family protein